MLPLHASINGENAVGNSTAGNQGLVFERFFNEYDQEFRVRDDAKTRFLNRFSGRTVGDEKALQAYAGRREQLVAALNGTFGVFTTDWHLVTGMGNAHPVENGFAWHPTLGTPYIAGSGVKGLLRAWVETCMEEDRASVDDRVRAWFGESTDDASDNQNAAAGRLMFFDAIPLTPPLLACDIMTPHMGGWYEKGGETVDAATIPGDWHNPVPIPFLVTRQAELLFSIAPRQAEDRALAEEALDALKDALAWLGASAKTASGYGHMSFDASKSDVREQQAQKATLTAEDQALETLQHRLSEEQRTGIQHPGGETKNLLRETVREAAEWPMDKRRALLELTGAILNHHDGAKWRKKKGKAKELYQYLSSLCE